MGKIKVKNVSERAVTVGHRRLYPGGVREVPVGVAAQALQRYPGALRSWPPALEEVEEELDQEPETEPRAIAVGTIKGIGPKWAERLAEAGVGSVEALAGLDDDGAEALLFELSGALKEEQLMDWVGQARRIGRAQGPAHTDDGD